MTVRILRVWMVLIGALAASNVIAASGDEFYDRLFNRGMAQFNEGNYANAYTSLRLAAFGLLEDVRRFETAEIHMTVAAMRLRRESDARAAAQRVIAGERIERRYASLSLPDAVRKEFEDAAKLLLTADQLNMLHGGAAVARPQMQPQPTTITIPPPVIVAAPQPPAPKPAPQSKPVQPQPQPVRPAPQPQPQTVVPAPAPPTQPSTRPGGEPSLVDADRAVNSGDLATARTLYRAALDSPTLSHASALRTAEG